MFNFNIITLLYLSLPNDLFHSKYLTIALYQFVNNHMHATSPLSWSSKWVFITQQIIKQLTINCKFKNLKLSRSPHKRYMSCFYTISDTVSIIKYYLDKLWLRGVIYLLIHNHSSDMKKKLILRNKWWDKSKPKKTWETWLWTSSSSHPSIHASMNRGKNAEKRIFRDINPNYCVISVAIKQSVNGNHFVSCHSNFIILTIF